MTSWPRRLLHRLSRWFLAGVFAILPLVITVAVVAWVANFLGQFLGPGAALGSLIRRIGLPFADDPLASYIAGTVVVLAFIFAVGLFVESGARSWAQPLVDGFFRRIPLLGPLYGTSQQVVGMIAPNDKGDLKQMKPVFVRFGEQGGCGFLALLVSPEPRRIGGQDYLIVIVPTAPVPVGGGMLFVPVLAVQEVDLSVEALMSIYVSMGITAGQFMPKSA